MNISLHMGEGRQICFITGTDGGAHKHHSCFRAIGLVCRIGHGQAEARTFACCTSSGKEGGFVQSIVIDFSPFLISILILGVRASM